MRIFLLCVVMATGCGLVDFDITQPIPEARIDGNPLPTPIQGLFPIPLDLDISAKIKKQTTGKIDSVTLSSLSLNITGTEQPAGDVDNFAFIDEIHVFVKSADEASELPRVEIASKIAPGEVQNFSFDVNTSVDLNDYLPGGTVVETEASGTAPPDAVSYDGQAVFTVHPL